MAVENDKGGNKTLLGTYHLNRPIWEEYLERADPHEIEENTGLSIEKLKGILNYLYEERIIN